MLDLIEGNVDVECRSERGALPIQERFQRVGLPGRPWEAVEQNPVLHHIGFTKACSNDANHHFVRDEVASLHNRFGPLTERSSGSYSGSQHVSGGYVDEAKFFDEASTLCALPRALTPKDDNSCCHGGSPEF